MMRLLRRCQSWQRQQQNRGQPFHPRIDVLVLQGAWRWDFKYLRRVLESDPNFSFTGFLPRGPGLYMQYGEPERGVQLSGFPGTRAELSGFDIIILAPLPVDPEVINEVFDDVVRVLDLNKKPRLAGVVIPFA